MLNETEVKTKMKHQTREDKLQSHEQLGASGKQNRGRVKEAIPDSAQTQIDEHCGYPQLVGREP
jgi:hypothetical protein